MNLFIKGPITHQAEYELTDATARLKALKCCTAHSAPLIISTGSLHTVIDEDDGAEGGLNYPPTNLSFKQ